MGRVQNIVSDEISQEDMEDLIALENACRRAGRQLRDAKWKMLGRLLAGAKVEIGIHNAEIVEIFEDGKRIQALEVH